MRIQKTTTGYSEATVCNQPTGKGGRADQRLPNDDLFLQRALAPRAIVTRTCMELKGWNRRAVVLLMPWDRVAFGVVGRWALVAKGVRFGELGLSWLCCCVPCSSHDIVPWGSHAESLQALEMKSLQEPYRALQPHASLLGQGS